MNDVKSGGVAKSRRHACAQILRILVLSSNNLGASSMYCTVRSCSFTGRHRISCICGSVLSMDDVVRVETEACHWLVEGHVIWTKRTYVAVDQPPDRAGADIPRYSTIDQYLQLYRYFPTAILSWILVPRVATNPLVSANRSSHVEQRTFEAGLLAVVEFEVCKKLYCPITATSSTSVTISHHLRLHLIAPSSRQAGLVGSCAGFRPIPTS